MATASLPPRWLITTIWTGHRMLYRGSAGRLGLRAYSERLAGMLRLRSVGRTSGLERSVILCYMENGPDLVTLAMNGWDEKEPQWWRNLLANPDAEIDTVAGSRRIHARRAVGDERERLWNRLRTVKGWATDLDSMAELRGHPTAVVIFEPRG